MERRLQTKVQLLAYLPFLQKKAWKTANFSNNMSKMSGIKKTKHICCIEKFTVLLTQLSKVLKAQKSK